jgi:hypothetical protein
VDDSPYHDIYTKTFSHLPPDGTMDLVLSTSHVRTDEELVLVFRRYKLASGGFDDAGNSSALCNDSRGQRGELTGS